MHILVQNKYIGLFCSLHQCVKQLIHVQLKDSSQSRAKFDLQLSTQLGSLKNTYVNRDLCMSLVLLSFISTMICVKRTQDKSKC